MPGTDSSRTAALARQVEELRAYVRRLETREEELAALLREREQVTATLQAKCDRADARNSHVRARLASFVHRAADRVAAFALRARRLVRRA